MNPVWGWKLRTQNEGEINTSVGKRMGKDPEVRGLGIRKVPPIEKTSMRPSANWEEYNHKRREIKEKKGKVPPCRKALRPKPKGKIEKWGGSLDLLI